MKKRNDVVGVFLLDIYIQERVEGGSGSGSGGGKWKGGEI